MLILVNANVTSSNFRGSLDGAGGGGSLCHVSKEQ